MKELIDWMINIDPSFWVILGSAIGVSSITQALKHWLSLESPKVIILLTTGISAILVAIQYFTYYAAQNPAILGENTAVMLGISTLAYRFLVQPFYGLLIDAKTYRSNQAAQNISAITETILDSKEEITPVLDQIIAERNQEQQQAVKEPEQPKQSELPVTDEFIG